MSFPTRALISRKRFRFVERACLFDGPPRSAKISELGRIADLGDVPGFGTDAQRGLLLDYSSDRRWPKGNRVTALGHRDVVLSSVLAEEEPFFTLQQGCEV